MAKRRFKHWRIYALIGFFFLAELVILGRLFSLQVLKHDLYIAKAFEQRHLFAKLAPKRGEIFTRDRFNEFYPLVLNKKFNLLFVAPKEVEDVQETAKKLAPAAGISEDDLLRVLSKKQDPYEPLKHKVDDELAEKIDSLGLPGVGFEPETVRYWPERVLASHAAGYYGFKNGIEGGQYGLEEFYDKILSGLAGTFEGEKDTQGYWITLGKKIVTPAENGRDLLLTIDRNIQFKAEELLAAAVEKNKAEGGTIVAMDPKTGRILALANFPNYDPNEYQKTEVNLFKNSAISNLFEPGSVFKPFTLAAAMNEGKIEPSTIYDDTGEVRFGGYVVKNSDYKSHGITTMTQVLEKSLNTGAIFAQQQLGKELFKKYFENFGFNEKTGVDLAGEIKSDISNLEKKGEAREINFATASFGQGVAVTPIALTRAFSVLANGGKLVQPFLVEEMRKAGGESAKIEPRPVRQIISEQTSSKITAMLISAVRNGFGRHAGVKGYFVAGKTGTAQVPYSDKRGYSDKTIHSFIGYAPAWNPAFTILVKLDGPQGVRFAETSAAPVFRELASFILNYYEIPPDEK